MSPRRRARTAVAAAFAAALLAGCASIPVTGDVQRGRDEVPRGPDVGQIPRGPAEDAEPDAIVNGFLLAAQAGPTLPAGLDVAREFLTRMAAEAWSPENCVLVTDGLPALVQDAAAEAATEPPEDRTTVHARTRAVASLDERGAFSEEMAAPHELTFELEREAGQWRIAQLDDCVIVPSPTFGATFHVTTLYFPTPDLTSWVPDVRWFPQSTWRTNAVQALLAGPPDYLLGAASLILPEGTRLTRPVTEGVGGALEVDFSDQINEVPAETLGLFAAQVRATLADGRAEPEVTLIDADGPVVPPDVETPQFPRTPGKAFVLQEGTLKNLVGRTLEPSEVSVDLTGLDPQQIAVSQDGTVVVVRDGLGRLVRVTDEDRPTLLSGTMLVPPSIDRTGAVWSADVGGPIVVVPPSADPKALDVPWLEGREIVSVRVSPEGARVAVVSQGDDGTSVQVAGIRRDADGVPTTLAAPTTVGASVRDVEQAVWQEEAVLALLGHDETGAAAVYFAGVGGLSTSTDGTPRRVSGITEPRWLSASVGTGDVLLAIDEEGQLWARQSTAVWALVGAAVQLAAFAG